MNPQNVKLIVLEVDNEGYNHSERQKLQKDIHDAQQNFKARESQFNQAEAYFENNRAKLKEQGPQMVRMARWDRDDKRKEMTR